MLFRSESEKSSEEEMARGARCEDKEHLLLKQVVLKMFPDSNNSNMSRGDRAFVWLEGITH